MGGAGRMSETDRRLVMDVQQSAIKIGRRGSLVVYTALVVVNQLGFTMEVS